MLALGREDIAVLRLELLVSPLKAMFFALTSDHEPGAAESPMAQLEALAEAEVTS